ncbi:MAG: hypothetical protein ABI390_11130 [Daejeonella sp.]
MANNITIMSPEIYDFSNLIDEHFDYTDEVKSGFLAYILSFFN